MYSFISFFKNVENRRNHEKSSKNTLKNNVFFANPNANFDHLKLSCFSLSSRTKKSGSPFENLTKNAIVWRGYDKLACLNFCSSHLAPGGPPGGPPGARWEEQKFKHAYPAKQWKTACFPFPLSKLIKIDQSWWKCWSINMLINILINMLINMLGAAFLSAVEHDNLRNFNFLSLKRTFSTQLQRQISKNGANPFEVRNKKCARKKSRARI